MNRDSTSRDDALPPFSVDDTLARSRRGLLIETVTAMVADVLTAPMVMTALPRVLQEVAKVVRIDRMAVIAMEQHRDGRRAPEVVYHWEAPNISPMPDLGDWLQTRPNRTQIDDWFRPLASGSTVMTNDRTAPIGVRELLRHVGVVSTLQVPIMVDGQHWGHIAYDHCETERDWASDDIKILKLLAEVVGAAITRERFLKESQHREKMLHVLTQSAAVIMTAADSQTAISEALGVIAEAVGIDRMLVFEANPGGTPSNILRNSWRAPDVPLMLPAIVESISTPVEEEMRVFLEPLGNGAPVQARLSEVHGSLKQFFDTFQIKSVLIVPIMADGRLWGQVGIDDCRRERRWTATEIDILKTLAELIGSAITRQRYTEELRKANMIIQNSPTILYRLRGEPAFPMIYVSQNVAQLGHDSGYLLQSPEHYRSIFHADDWPQVQAAMTETLNKDSAPSTIEVRVLTKTGEVRWVENRNTPVRDGDGRLIEIEGILIDVTERKAAEEKIAQLARTDVLTGIANRMTFGDRLRQVFASALRGAHPFAVHYLDLDHFKEVNDTLGHLTGDKLLQLVSQRLRDNTREIDVVARLGGDEFAVLQAEVTDSSVAGRLAEKFVEALSAPYQIEGRAVRVGVSVGIALFDQDSASPEMVLSQADQALYRAKDGGRGQYRFYSDEIDHETRAHLALANELRNALVNEELEVYYQPQVELASGKIVGMEALVRWNHPVRGTLLPEDFLPIAERFSLMQPLGRWVLDAACRQMSIWRKAKMKVPVIAINVALAQIKMGREFVSDVKESLARWDLVPSDLEFDVTELVFARTTLSQSNVLEELQALGVSIAIDDFGAQYSSLDYLRTYHVNRLKIARGMIAAATAEPGGSAMIRAILSLAGELGVEVVAEGVETQMQRDLLVKASSKAQGQGFYYCRAVPAEETLELLRLGIVVPEKKQE